MDTFDEPKFFSNAELKKLKDLESQTISRVVYYYWVNNTKPNEPVQLLDNIEITFIDKIKIVFAASELNDAIELPDINFTEKALELRERFKGTIYLTAKEMTSAEPWLKAVEYAIDEVLLDSDGHKQFYSDKMILKMGPIKIQLDITTHGLQVLEMNENWN